MTFTAQEALQRTIDHREIFYDEMLSLMRQIMAGEVSPVMTAAILTGLRVKKETIGEIAAAATVMRELSTKVVVPPRQRPLPRRGGHRRRRLPHLQHLHRHDLRGRGGRCQGGQARRAQRLQQVGQRRRAGVPGREPQPQRPAGGRVHRGNRHRLHVCPQPPQRHEERGPGAPRDGRAHPVQHPWPADQPGRRAQHPARRVPPRSRRHLRARDGAPRRQARDGGVRPRQHGRSVAGRRHSGRRAEGRARSANTRSTPRTSA
jgi:hypothetical protein